MVFNDFFSDMLPHFGCMDMLYLYHYRYYMYIYIYIIPIYLFGIYWWSRSSGFQENPAAWRWKRLLSCCPLANWVWLSGSRTILSEIYNSWVSHPNFCYISIIVWVDIYKIYEHYTATTTNKGAPPCVPAKNCRLHLKGGWGSPNTKMTYLSPGSIWIHMT